VAADDGRHADDLGVPLADGRLDFALDGDGVAHLRRLGFRLAGGTVEAAAGQRLALDEARQSLRLDVRGVELGGLAGLTGVDGLTATGAIGGTLPLAIDGGAVTIAGGRLESAGKGRIAYAPANAAAGLDGAGNAAFEVLRNFEYDRIALDVAGAVDGELEVNASVEGRNPDYYDGYPVNLSFRLSGMLGNILRTGITSYNVPDDVRERMLEFAR